MEILAFSRGCIRVGVRNRKILLTGEILPPDRPVQFFIDLVSIQRWEDGTPVSNDDKIEILCELPKAASRRGWTLEFD